MKDISSAVHRAIQHYQLNSNSKLLRRLNVKNEKRIVANLAKRHQAKHLVELLLKRDHYTNKINELLNSAGEETNPKLIEDEYEAEYYLTRRFSRMSESMGQVKALISKHMEFQDEMAREHEKILQQYKSKQPAANGLAKLKAMNAVGEASRQAAKSAALNQLYERVSRNQQKLAQESEAMLRQMGVPFFCLEATIAIDETQLKRGKEQALDTLYKLVEAEPRATISSLSNTAGKPNSAFMWNCLPPGNVFNFQIKHDFSGIHFTLPYSGVNFGVSASSGIGMMISTLFAVDFFLICARAEHKISIRECLCTTVLQFTKISGFIKNCADSKRYDITVNSPSGGMNVMMRSFSNLDNLTHWWNLMSSISIFFEPGADSDAVSSSILLVNMPLSFNPNRRSGIPLNFDFILTSPKISLFNTWPLALMSMLIDSTTSKNASFFLYVMPSFLQLTAFVTALGGCTNLFVVLRINL